MRPKLAELLEMDNPYWFWSTISAHYAYNRALEDAWEKMGALRVLPGCEMRAHFTVEALGVGPTKLDFYRWGPGYLAWIPDGVKCNTCDDKELVLRQDEIGFCPSCHPHVGAACV